MKPRTDIDSKLRRLRLKNVLVGLLLIAVLAAVVAALHAMSFCA